MGPFRALCCNSLDLSPLAPSATVVANFLAEVAGPLPHEGGLKSESVRVLASTLKMALKDRGVDVESLPDSRASDCLRNRPDRSTPRNERWDTDKLVTH